MMTWQEIEKKLPKGDVEKVMYALEAVHNVFGYALEKLQSRDRTQELVGARRIFMVLLRKHIKLSQQCIGDITGRDHATVLYALKVHDGEEAVKFPIRNYEENYEKAEKIFRQKLNIPADIEMRECPACGHNFAI